MRNMLIATAAVLLAHASIGAAETYTPPAASATALKGIDLSGEPVAASFKKDFADCDTIPHTVRGVPQTQCFGSRRVKVPNPANPQQPKYETVRDASLPSDDPNRNTTILKLASRAILFDAKMGIDNDGSPFAGVWPSNQQTSLFYSDGKTSINADRIQYIAVPSGFDRETGFALGDVAAVVYNDKVEYALVADHSKPFRIGEGSVALHDAIGHKGCNERALDGDCKKPANGSIPNGVTFIAFPGTKSKVCEGLAAPKASNVLCAGMTPEMLGQRIQSVGKASFDALKSGVGQ
jgi:hypothetical protein